MSIAQALLPEFEQEMAATRKVLERVPDDKLDWSPHEKSMTLGRLATHVAELPMWTGVSLDQDEVDVNPPDGQQWESPKPTTVAEILELFDTNSAEGREKIASAGDATFFEDWSLKSGGETLFVMPKVAVIRSFVLNHGIHHRGQLTVFLRLLDVPLPQTYGPTADEPDF